MLMSLNYLDFAFTSTARAWDACGRWWTALTPKAKRLGHATRQFSVARVISTSVAPSRLCSDGGIAVPGAPTLSLPDLQAKCKQIRRDIITSTTTAGSGHPTSSLSAVEIAAALYFGG